MPSSKVPTDPPDQAVTMNDASESAAVDDTGDVQHVNRFRPSRSGKLLLDPDWPLPKGVKIFRSRRPTEEAISAGDKCFILLHPINILPIFTRRNCIIGAVVTLWVFLVARYSSFPLFSNSAWSLTRGLTFTFLALWFAVRLADYLFHAHHNYGVANERGIAVYEGWWRPKQSWIPRNRFVDQEVVLPNPFLRFLHLDVGTLLIDTAGRIPNARLERVAWAGQIALIYKGLTGDTSKIQTEDPGPSISQQPNPLADSSDIALLLRDLANTGREHVALLKESNELAALLVYRAGATKRDLIQALGADAAEKYPEPERLPGRPSSERPPAAPQTAPTTPMRISTPPPSSDQQHR